MTIREALRTLWAGRVLVLAAVVLVLAGTVLYLQRQVPQYEASTTVQILAADNAATEQQAVVTADTDPAIVQSEEVVTAAAESLADGTTAAALANAVQGTFNSESLVMDVIATAESPEAAVARANAVAQAYIAYLPTQLQGRIDSLEERREALRAQLEDVEERLDDSPSDPLAAAERDTIIEQYQSISGQQSAYASIVTPAQVLQPATGARSMNLPSSIVLAIGGLLGLVAGVALAFAYAGFDVRIRTVGDVRRLADSTVLAELFDTVGAEREYRRSGTVPVTTRQATPFTESIRELRTAVSVALGDRTNATVVVTAADPLAPRAFITANLAASFALSGRSTILVAGDMRQPQFGELLTDDDTPESGALGLVRTKVANLRLLVLQDALMDPADYLARDEVRALITEARSRVPLVIVDAPPVLAAADATILGRYADGVVLVAALGRTDRAVLRAAGDRLRSNHVSLLGVAATGAKGNRRMLYASTYGGVESHEDTDHGGPGQRAPTPAATIERDEPDAVAEQGASAGTGPRRHRDAQNGG